MVVVVVVVVVVTVVVVVVVVAATVASGLVKVTASDASCVSLQAVLT